MASNSQYNCARTPLLVVSLKCVPSFWEQTISCPKSQSLLKPLVGEGRGRGLFNKSIWIKVIKDGLLRKLFAKSRHYVQEGTAPGSAWALAEMRSEPRGCRISRCVRHQLTAGWVLGWVLGLALQWVSGRGFHVSTFPLLCQWGYPAQGRDQIST